MEVYMYIYIFTAKYIIHRYNRFF